MNGRTALAAHALTFAMATCTVTLLYLLFFEEPFVSYRNLPFPPLVASVKPGDIVPLRVVRCSSAARPRTYQIARSLENLATGRTYVIPESVVQIKPGCTDEVSLANRVPLDVEPGLYRVIGLAEVEGTLRPHLVAWTSGEFTVAR